jgi:hypothetical protein
MMHDKRGRPAGVWLELKLGTVVKGELRFNLRVAQRKVLQQLEGWGAHVYVLVAHKGTSKAYLLPATKQHLTGRVPYMQLSEIKGAFAL